MLRSRLLFQATEGECESATRLLRVLGLIRHYCILFPGSDTDVVGYRFFFFYPLRRFSSSIRFVKMSLQLSLLAFWLLGAKYATLRRIAGLQLVRFIIYGAVVSFTWNFVWIYRAHNFSFWTKGYFCGCNSVDHFFPKCCIRSRVFLNSSDLVYPSQN